MRLASRGKRVFGVGGCISLIDLRPMVRPEPYWARYLPSWKRTVWNPPEIKINKSSQLDSCTKKDPRCERCTWSCNHCPYSLIKTTTL